MASARENAFVAVLGLLSACGALGCSSDGATPAGAGGNTGAGGTGNGCEGIDYASFSSGPSPSFSKDVMPIFGLSCTAGDCHNSQVKKATLDLGWRCNYDLATKTCPFPATSVPNATAQPLTQEVIDAVYLSLMAPAKTVTSPTVQRVIPNDPEHSFLIEKVAGTQQRPEYTCTNTDPSHTAKPLPCGDPMPLNNPPLCMDPARFETLARWIAHGALKN